MSVLKRISSILIAMAVLITFSGCEDSEELSAVEKELSEVEAILGNIANDYLNTEITQEEAKEKLDVLSSRVEGIEKNAKDEVTIYTGDDPYLRASAFTEKEHCQSLETAINYFEYLIWESNIPGRTQSSDSKTIVDIRDKYYKS